MKATLTRDAHPGRAPREPLPRRAAAETREAV